MVSNDWVSNDWVTGASSKESTQPCGCDPGFVSTDGQRGWVCEQHRASNDFYHPIPESQPRNSVVLTTYPTQTGDPRFHALLKQLGDLHSLKQKDYGTSADPYANVRSSAEWGIAPWVGALVRATDKVKRLQKFARVGSLANEGVEDSLLDLAVYAIIALILYREPK